MKLKSALYGHAYKLSANLGIKYAAGGLECQFSGDGAFAAWLGGEHVKAVIRYPTIPDNASLSRGEADLFTGYTLHEVGHIAFTDNGTRPVWLGYSPVERVLLKNLWNGIEDGRMEYCVISDGRSRGARSALRRLLANMTHKMPSDWSPTNIKHAPFALALLSRSALGVGNAYSNGLLKRIPKPKHDLYEEAFKRCAMLPTDPALGTKEAWNLAVWFLEEWKSRYGLATADRTVVVNSSNNAKPEDNGGKTPDEYNASGEDDLLTNDRVIDVGEGTDSDELPTPDLGDAPRIDPEDESVEKPETSSATAEGEDTTEEGELEGGEQRGGDVGGEEVDLDKLFSENEEDNKVKGEKGEDIVSPEPNLNDVAKRISERTRTGVVLPHAAPSNISDMSKWKNANSDRKANESSDKRMHRKILGAGTAKLKAIVTRLLTAPERWGWDSGAFAGRFDTRRGVQAMNGSEAVFKRRWETEGLNTALSIVIDSSGSMSGRMGLAVDAAYAIAEAAEAARCSVEVQAFSNAVATGSGMYAANDMFGLNVGVGSQMGTTSLLVAKPFHKKIVDCAVNFGNLKRIHTGSTPDYATVKTAATRLSYRPEGRKIIMVLTDGYGEISSMGLLCEHSQQLLGVEIIGIAIGMDEKHFGRAFREAYPTGAAFVDDISQLGGKSMQMLEKSLRRTSRTRRVM
jgi:hypothetical protein